MVGLSALLARDRVVPAHKIDEAIQRQVTNGGDFETNLLEVHALGEDALALYAALTTGLRAATRDEVRSADPAAIARVPAELAVRAQAVALRFEDGAALVAVASMPTNEVIEALAQAVGGGGARVELRVVTPVRIAAGLSKHYGVAPSARHLRLIERLDTDPAPMQHAPPGPGERATSAEAESKANAPVGSGPVSRPSMDRLKSSALQALASILDDDDDDEEEEDEGRPTLEVPDPLAVHQRITAPAPAPAAVAPAPEPEKPAPPTETPPAESVETPQSEAIEAAATEESAEPQRSAEPQQAETPQESEAPDARARSEQPSTPTPTQGSTAPTSGFVRTSAPPPAPLPDAAGETAAEPEPAAAAVRSAQPPAVTSAVGREPIVVPESDGLDPARERLRAAPGRDELVTVLLDHASARARYVAVFVLHGEVAEGLDARGQGPGTDAIRALSAPLGVPGALRSVRESAEPVLLRFDAATGPTSVDAALRTALSRGAGGGAREASLFPVRIAGRVVLVLWADAGPEGELTARGRAELAALSNEAAACFERLVRERKKQRAPQSATEGAAPSGAAKKAEKSQGAGVLKAPARRQPMTRPPWLLSVEHTAVGRAQADALRANPPPAPGTAPRTASAPAVVPASEPTAVAAAMKAPAVPSFSAFEVGEARAPESAPAEVRDTRDPQDTREESRTGPLVPARRSSMPPALSSSSTRFVRGGRVPIAVDVVGPLPTASEPFGVSVPQGYGHDAGSSSDEGDETVRLVHEIVRTGTLTDEQTTRLLSAGDRALQSVFRYFPGPVSVDRNETQAPRPPVSDVGPLLRLAVMFRQASAPWLSALLDSVDPEQRYFAAWCLGDVLHPGALPKLVARLFDADFPTRAVALEALRSYRRLPEFEHAARTLRAMVQDRSGQPERRRTAVRTLAELRDADAIPVLIDALGDPDAELVPIAQAALVSLSRQDFGARIGEWRAWWALASSRHRIEWLIEALQHPEGTLRHEASEELKKLTGQFFGYYFNLPRREREKAHRRYVEWWEREGRGRFAR